MDNDARYIGLILRKPEDNLAAEVRRGLTLEPKHLPCKYFYDARGMELYEQICALPEYYLTRTETAILHGHADEIIALCPGHLELVELGSGCGDKPRLLIEACLRRQSELVYHAIDLAPSAMADAAKPLLRDYPRLRFTGLAGEFADGLRHLAGHDGPPRFIVFLGSTIGNFDEGELRAFFSLLQQVLRAEDRFLLGFDLLKDPAVLIPAYDDGRGVTAAFNRNLLTRINRELRADFEPAAFEHQAIFNAARSRVEMRLISTREQTVELGSLDLKVAFRRGESIHTENCYKHSQSAMRDKLSQHGMRVLGAWSDSRGWFCDYLIGA